MKISTEVLVIGGGATGLGAAWDAALRGFKCILVEKGDLAHGTSGRYHGLLHSGARYAVRDPQSAAECYRENLLLRRLMPSTIEETGGFFVALPEDPTEYVEPFLAGCRAAGIPAEEVSPAQVLAAEPLLNPEIQRAYHVPDAACDSFDATHALAAAVGAAGGEVRTRHKVVELLRSAAGIGGVVVEDLTSGERLTIAADIVLNCAGAWAGAVAGLAGCDVRVTPAKGTMIAMNSRLVQTVVNRLKPPGDGDILVPIGTVAVIGTTERVVASPDQYQIEAHEIDLLLEEGAKLIPRFREFRALRAWAGVRPLYQDSPSPEGESRLIPRAHSVLDHALRDGVEGLVTVVGGKFTTFRVMAEQAVDLVCRKLEVERPSRTATTPIEHGQARPHRLGRRLGEREQDAAAQVVCECELVTRDQVERALRRSASLILNDLRRDLRLGMGPCQAGFCAFRAAGIAYDIFHGAGQTVDGDALDRAESAPCDSEATRAAAGRANSALLEFLQERWKGLRPVMWGTNLRQLELDLNIYRNLLGADRLPRARAPEEYPSEQTA